MKRHISIISMVIVIICGSCKNRNDVHSIRLTSKSNFYYYSLGLNELASVDSSFVPECFRALENVELSQALDIIVKQNFAIEYIYGGYFILSSLSKNPKPVDYYLSYRFAEAQGDIDNNYLDRLLVSSHISLQRDSADPDSLAFLISLEDDYLKMYDKNTGAIDTSKLQGFKKYLIKEKEIGRIQFLWGVANFKANLYDESLNSFRLLLSKNKYEKRIYKLLSLYYSQIGNDSSQYYQNLLETKYPNDCNLDKLKRLSTTSSEVEIESEFNKCKCNNKINDSIEAGVFRTSFYLNNGDLSRTESMLNSYYNSDTSFSFSEKQTWERRSYFYIKSKLLLEKRLYNDLIKFVIKETGGNEIIKMEVEGDFKLFLKQLYKESFKKQPQKEDFDKFYENNFRMPLIRTMHNTLQST
jgi:hypothetical protein